MIDDSTFGIDIDSNDDNVVLELLAYLLESNLTCKAGVVMEVEVLRGDDISNELFDDMGALGEEDKEEINECEVVVEDVFKLFFSLL